MIGLFQNDSRRRSGWYVLLVVLIAFVSGCNLPSFGIGDDNRHNISLEEAQNLVPFAICLPQYIPANIQLDPQVNYHADFGDPMESDVRLLYYSSSQQDKPAIEVYEYHSPDELITEPMLEDWREFYLRELQKWIYGKYVKDMLKKPKLITQAFVETDPGMVRWIFEISDDRGQYANVIVWVSDPVRYETYTRLPIEEAKHVIRSIPEISSCGLKTTNGWRLH